MSEIIDPTSQETPQESDAVLGLQQTASDEEDVQAHSDKEFAAGSTVSLAACA
jgi:hypothetical protein